MRTKDDIKREALFEATVAVVNEIGFAASSVSRIARKAGVSPATLYVYHENKEQLLISTYLAIKAGLGQASLEGFNAKRPLRDILKTVWANMFRHISRHPGHFQFTEQFASSPYSDRVDKAEVERQFEPLMAVLQEGIRQKIIKDVPFEILGAFLVHPILVLCNTRLCREFTVTGDHIEMAFAMSWDAIRR